MSYEQLKKDHPVMYEALMFGYELEKKGFTKEEAKEIFEKMILLLRIAKEKRILLRAIEREGKLLDKINLKRKYGIGSNKGKKYRTKKSEIIKILKAKAKVEIKEDWTEIKVIPKEVFEIYVENEDMSRTTKWRIRKELEEEGYSIKTTEEYM